MKISLTSLQLDDLDVDLLLIPVGLNTRDAVLSSLSALLGESVTRAAADFTGDMDNAVLVYPEKTGARRVGLLGMGAEDQLDAEKLRLVAASGADMVFAHKTLTVAFALPNTLLDTDLVSQAVVEGFCLASYRFSRYKTNDGTSFQGAERLVIHVLTQEKGGRNGAERGRIMAESVMKARDLVNLSPDEKTATLLSQAIEKSAKKWGYSASVWDKALIIDEGMGGLLAVNRGSTEPPTFTVMEWRPELARNDHPIVLIGKGIVFDTGGLSLKATKDSMDHMKSDMAGAAAVIGAIEAISRLNIPIYVIGLIPATDNRPGENAYVPGDIVKMHSGKSVEVLNTDAEGRLILADALSYAHTYSPELVIDIATLTGAQVVALGNEVAAVMTNETEGAAHRLNRIEEAGRRSGELVHRLPMFAHYGKLLESEVADIKNVGGREAGTITAAKFLEHFVDYPWLHIDMAGPSFLSESKPYRPKGGTGFGVRLLVEFLRDQAMLRR